jgi:predicted ATPase
MALSNEVRRLQAKWQTGTNWPQRLEWIEIKGLRGWTGQRFELRFPIMAVTGENGVGKSTVLQCAASVYASTPPAYRRGFASDFFPDTTWDHLRGIDIRYALREGDRQTTDSIRKPGARWRGNQDRRERHVEYIDLSRIQPVPARVGYLKLANPALAEASATAFEAERLERFSGIMGRPYDLAKMATTDADANRLVPVLSQQGSVYSGFHQGAGETTVAELLQADLPNYSLVLIDEVESSLHPRAQRRLIRDLAELSRQHQLQVILTTHSPYVLEELPLEARAYVLQTPAGTREIVYGVSPDFAMTKMDDLQHSECDLYVEDRAAATMLTEILVVASPETVGRCRTIPYGAAGVGQALGQMVVGNRFPRPSCVFLDGDQGTAPGCLNLPGDDAPERVVFGDLEPKGWANVHSRVGRAYADVADACSRAMLQPDHHTWVSYAASRLTLGGETLWQAMCAEWANLCLPEADAKAVAEPIEDVLSGIESYRAAVPVTTVPAEAKETSPTGQTPLFEQ